MALTRAFVPYGGYWSTPFCKWQGALAGWHSIELAAQVARGALAERGLSSRLGLDGVFLGTTVPQKHAFYGAPWLAGLLGAEGVTGPTLSQACATSARVIASAAAAVEIGTRTCVLGVLADRTSNGPHLYYPNPDGPGGRGESEDWVWDAFGHDPWAGNAMIETAEAVAREAGIGRAEQEALTLLRFAQYEEALEGGRAFQKRYMVPVSLERRRGERRVVEGDEGVPSASAEGLAKLRPVVEGGSVTAGTQTRAADGSAGIVVCTEDRAKELSRDPAIPVRIVGLGEARVEKGRMPKAVVPAARRALEHAGLGMADVRAVKTHNPFAVNDIWFSRETGVPLERMNRFGSPLVYGHPQAPTGCRLVIELVEELALCGGGYGLFTGCAAGDTAMSLVVRVG